MSKLRMGACIGIAAGIALGSALPSLEVRALAISLFGLLGVFFYYR
jgi:hypothetical protein